MNIRSILLLSSALRLAAWFRVNDLFFKGLWINGWEATA